MSKNLLVLTKLAFLLFLAAVATSSAQSKSEDVEKEIPDYVGTEVCSKCHQSETEAWKGSHHDLAWTYANKKTVLGDFDGAVFEHSSDQANFSIENDGFFVETNDQNGVLRKFQVVGVAGIAPLQQYLVDIGDGHIQALDVAWDVEEERWYHLYPDQEYEPGNGLHWTGPYKNWNARCAECHATGFEKNYDPITKRYRSGAAEIGVGCEACHGPGEAHVDWAREASSEQSYGSELTKTGLVVGLSDKNAETEIQQCATCHSRREPFLDGNPLPGTPFHDAYRLSLLRPGLYHADGQILEEVYVYGSFLQSKMYEKGVRCSDCHDPHAARLKADGNAVCTQCHSPEGNSVFPSLRNALYDSSDHHFHQEGSEGAQCKSCHMIERVYMGIDGRRDHSFRVPRPDLTAKIGTPNACSDCHTDKDAAWAATEIEKRFPESDHRGKHFGELFAQVQGGANLDMPLLELAEYQGMPAIVRATALDYLAGTQNPEIIDRSVDLLRDESPLVRAAAIVVQRGGEPMNKIRELTPLLSDPVRSVRMAAAREFLNAPIARFPQKIEAAYRKALSEWRTSLMARADFPETHLALGGAALTMRNLQAAEAAFREAVRMDPQLVDGWRMIIRILQARGENEAAASTAEEALSVNPENEMLTQLKSQFD